MSRRSCWRHLADIHAIHQDRAVGHIVEARDQVDDGGFTRAGGADEGGGLPGLGGEGDIVQHILLRAGVAEGDIAEFDRAVERLGELLGALRDP